MFEENPGAPNRAICSKCSQPVTARHEESEGKVYLVKECPDCGDSRIVISSDAGRYREKRELVSYEHEAETTCSLRCDECKSHKTPTLVFIDVTNRCNMNCPICLANIPAMGFRFDPPMAYFEKIFAVLSKLSPKPKIQLFGGEPTCREDLIDMINLAKEKYGLSARVVTNGLRLADEEYCKKLLATGTQVMFSFDGRSPKIYERTRKHPKALEKKLQGLENVRKYRKSKATIMCCVGEGVNDEYLADLIDYCHEGRDFIAALDLIPLVATWGPEEVDAKTSTVEDVERMMTKAIPGMEFVPAAVMYRFETLLSTFNVGRLTFGGAHPNCEMVSLLVSDAKGYHPPSRFLKRPFQEAVRDLLQLDREMGKNLKSHWISNLFGRRGQRFVYGKALWKLIRRNLDLDEIFGGSPWQGAARVGWDLLRGRKFKEVLRRHTHLHGILRVIVLPFVEQDWVESARLVDCPANFAYEHPKTKEIRLMPVCAWAIYKDDILRVTSEEYGLDHKTGQDGLTGLKNRTDIEPEAAIN